MERSRWDVLEKKSYYLKKRKKKLSCWKSKLLSAGSNPTLINSVLRSVPIFMLTFLRSFGEFFLKNLIIIYQEFICQCGLGILNLNEMFAPQTVIQVNKWGRGVAKYSLKQIWWKKIISLVEKKSSDSPFLLGLMKVKHEFCVQVLFCWKMELKFVYERMCGLDGKSFKDHYLML